MLPILPSATQYILPSCMAYTRVGLSTNRARGYSGPSSPSTGERRDHARDEDSLTCLSWMSLLMGRPPSIGDDAITLELPQECQGLPSPVGLRANVLLSRISGFISANSCRLTPHTYPPNSSVSYFDQALNMLADWLANLPPVLQISDEVTTQDRAAVCLHISYNQASGTPGPQPRYRPIPLLLTGPPS